MLMLFTVIKYLKTLLNYMQKNNQQQTRPNNSCMMERDCNDLQKKATARKAGFANYRAELLKQHLSQSSLEL